MLMGMLQSLLFCFRRAARLQTRSSESKRKSQLLTIPGSLAVLCSSKQTLGATESLQALANAFAPEGAYGSSQKQTAQVRLNSFFLISRRSALVA